MIPALSSCPAEHVVLVEEGGSARGIRRIRLRLAPRQALTSFVSHDCHRVVVLGEALKKRYLTKNRATSKINIFPIIEFFFFFLTSRNPTRPGLDKKKVYEGNPMSAKSGWST